MSVFVSDLDIVSAMTSKSGPTLEPSDADPDALVEILYTSGSTGLPKGVMLSHANPMIGARAVASYLELAPDDRTLALLPLSFDYGQNQLFSTWWAGGCVVPLDYLLPGHVAKAAAEQQRSPRWPVCRRFGCSWSRPNGPKSRAFICGGLTNSGGALTRPLIAKMRGTFSGIDIVAMYGLTEAFRSTYLPPALLDAHPTSIGRAIPDAEVLVVRPDGSLTNDGEPGELASCGPLVAQGYWRDPNADGGALPAGSRGVALRRNCGLVGRHGGA